MLKMLPCTCLVGMSAAASLVQAGHRNLCKDSFFHGFDSHFGVPPKESGLVLDCYYNAGDGRVAVNYADDVVGDDVYPFVGDKQMRTDVRDIDTLSPARDFLNVPEIKVELDPCHGEDKFPHEKCALLERPAGELLLYGTQHAFNILDKKYDDSCIDKGHEAIPFSAAHSAPVLDGLVRHAASSSTNSAEEPDSLIRVPDDTDSRTLEGFVFSGTH
uniref:Uncharacterized protein n=1 Tax=Favella ehrenbergii TaxID=182087 RepID=A0A7S3MNX6_9SPIT|mmetsp:Transcript_7006/g.8439  ORF Transcript_7006/g.8439 Transcript_7006/m.8439 type:complete len:216 (+) Transcript_7006:40-687(+)|eukprot:CAMPEP_0170465286 /NCGR_PEP_ID=MMETSP0123-20130129/9686_1 /TAXON_ID=182087 /ORGANISM="Favella ehrenbergii, Strain Fehren 1" /LENGTH=215 /DNA_ID=CAMNT_0010731143 /DNA_START=18 /DNA_END=665 /DNA_ORIENTATION=-